MGGSINIAARFNDGEAICIDGWTNFIPRMVMNQTTLSGDDRIVRETLMEAAAQKHYAGAQPFRASGYGIVVIDFVAKAIHSMQGYTGFSRRKILGHFMDFGGTGWKGEGDLRGMQKFLENGSLEDYEVKISEEGLSLMKAGRLKVVENNGEDIEPYVLDEQKMIDLVKDDTARFLRNQERDIPLVQVDLKPFAAFDYPEGGSLVSMKQQLRDAGFPLTKAEGLNAMFAEQPKETT